MNRIDLPFSAASATPSGPSTPWLIALLRNSTLAGSTRIDASGSRLFVDQAVDAVAGALVNHVDDRADAPRRRASAMPPPMMPAEKLSTSISKPGRILSSISLSNSLRMYAASGPMIIAPRNIGTSAPTTTPTVATAPTTAPRWPWTSRPPV